MTKTNLFHWATSELSQDAFLCWILAWANPTEATQDEGLHQAAQCFLQGLLTKCNAPFAVQDVTRVIPHKQEQNIDVWAQLQLKSGTEYALLIEDKTGTSHHDNQLQRYDRYLQGLDAQGKQQIDPKRQYAKDNILKIYYTSIEEPNYKIVNKDGYVVFERADALQYLGAAVKLTDNPILHNYHEHLQSIEQEVQLYKTHPPSYFEQQQTNLPWLGFLKDLKQQTGNSENCWWGYVPNQSGGFMCFADTIDAREREDHLYIQIDCKKGALQVRVEVSKERSREEQLKVREKLIKRLTQSKVLDKPQRRGTGKTMAIGEKQLWQADTPHPLNVEHIADEIMNLKQVLSQLI